MGNTEVKSLSTILKEVDIKARFQDMLGKKAPGFMSSIISAVNQNSSLKKCNPMTVISSAAIAASLDLPINPSLGFAYIVPYAGLAQFQMGWKGFVQLAMRSGQYRTINVSEVYEDEFKGWNPISGEIEFNPQDTWSQRYEGKYDKIVGYVAFFKLLNGFEKYSYMTKQEVIAHGQKYSKAYTSNKGQWRLNFDAMAKKTVLKLLLSRFGILSIDMQKALTSDQAVISEDGTPKYIDGEAQEISSEEMPRSKTEASKETKEEEIVFGGKDKPKEGDSGTTEETATEA